MIRYSLAAALALAWPPQPAVAHAVLSVTEASAGTYQKLEIRIPHGCQGSPTTEVHVEIPTGILRAKPQPKAGWTIAIIKERLPEPQKDAHGNVIAERVAQIRWSGGRLEDEHFDDFAISVKLPDKPGQTLYFPTRQLCETGAYYWAEINPADPAKAQPAPKLFLAPQPSSF